MSADNDIVQLDVTKESDWQAVFAAHGPFTALVNCAGVRTRSPLVDLSLEEWERVIRINLTGSFLAIKYFAPGPINTPMLAERLNEPGGREWLEDKVPMGRLGEPADCARGIAFLLSDESSYITGVTLPIDGGWLTR
jgi:NAD(P)-dependent dehydrogenase (short-subunit alcohol dehydrogenase family)